MFKRRVTGQQILPSELGTPSMTRAPAPMANSGSISADLGYLHHVGDGEREGLRERPATAINSISRPAGIQRRGLYIPAIELAAVNAPVWQVSTPENRSRDECDRHRAPGIPSCFMNKVKFLGLLFEIVHLFKFLLCRAAEET